MRRWLLPLLFGVVAALAAYHVSLLATPRILMAAAVKRVGQGGMNRMTHAPLATDRSRAIVRPSPDLAYSSCPFDLSAGPVRVVVPAIPSAYWSLSVFDADTDAVYVRNNTETQGHGIILNLALPGQVVPAGEAAVRLSADRGIALVRVLVEDRAGFVAIDRVRQQARCGPR